MANEQKKDLAEVLLDEIAACMKDAKVVQEGYQAHAKKSCQEVTRPPDKQPTTPPTTKKD